jgi:hypothetical protein
MKDAYYFPHDSNAKDDPKCILLIEQLGLEGYGIFWVLIETLRDQPNYSYPLNLLPALSRRYNTTFEKIKVVIQNYNLFKVENDELFYSESLRLRMSFFDRKREINRQKAIKRWSGDAMALPLQSQSMPVEYSKVKESKVNKSKVDESKGLKPERPKCWEDLMPIFCTQIKNRYGDDGFRQWLENGELERETERCFDHYQANGWTQSNGRIIKDYAAMVRNWLRFYEDFKAKAGGRK